MKYKLRNNKRGFTLVELIVVLTILAVLAAMLIPSCRDILRKALRPLMSSMGARRIWKC